MSRKNYRRLLIAWTLLAGLAISTPSFADGNNCDGARDLVLVNGKIHTMDKTDSVVSSVSIKGGKIATVGRGAEGAGPCARIINLQGRTAVPGLVDNHNHFVLLSLRPGHDVRLETATSIGDVQAAIAAKAKSVPSGEFITAIGGWNPAQFAEKRLPNLAELDAAAPQNPVFVMLAFTGPSTTNSLGKAFFQGQGITVSATGDIGANVPTIAALDALRAIQTFDDQKRGSLDAMAYSTSVGVTTNVDMGGFVIPGLPDIQDSFVLDTSASWDPFTAYDAFLELHREGKMTTRLRVFFLSMDTNPDIPLLSQRVLNAFREFGDDMMKVSGMGEFITSWPLFGNPFPSNYDAALQTVAQRGWIYQQHSLSLAEDQFIADHWEALNASTPIADLHWSAAHVPAIDQPTVDRFKALGVGLALHGFRYLSGSTRGGPPYRMIVDSGIHVGAGSDSAQISTLDPWLMIFYMVTGKNAAGLLVNAGQTLTRAEALRLYTANNGWFIKEEDKLGSIEEEKFGDIVVLSADFFDPTQVPDEAIKRIKSILTIVDGKVVFDAMH